mgnify:CR=1 FL=1
MMWLLKMIGSGIISMFTGGSLEKILDTINRKMDNDKSRGNEEVGRSTSPAPSRSDLVVPVVLRHPIGCMVDGSDPRLDLRVGAQYRSPSESSRRMGWLDHLGVVYRRWWQGAYREVQEMTAGKTMERTTDIIAAAGAVSPLWLQQLEQVSYTASLLLPIVSVGWIVLQAVLYFRKKK